ncbi:hypothetical protein BGX24_000447 [Mortierella sp. AD032]|nr:hypothetical protein BGX24_000447 [Mortierella sp. AD032]
MYDRHRVFTAASRVTPFVLATTLSTFQPKLRSQTPPSFKLQTHYWNPISSFKSSISLPKRLVQLINFSGTSPAIHLSERSADNRVPSDLSLPLFINPIIQPSQTSGQYKVLTNSHLKVHSRTTNVSSLTSVKERETGNGDGGVSRVSPEFIDERRKKSTSSTPGGSSLNLSNARGASTTPANPPPEKPQAANGHCLLSPDRLDSISGNYKNQTPFPTTTNLRDDIFLTDAPKPIVRSATPTDQRDRIESTRQLAFCASLIPKVPLLFVENSTTEVSVSNDAECAWVSAMQEDPSAQTQIRWLLTQLVVEFSKIPLPESKTISEVVILGHVLCRVDYRALLLSFIEKCEQMPQLNIDLLRGLVQVVQSASPGFLAGNDLVRILELLRLCLESTYAPSRKHVYLLVLAVAKVLEVMVTREVKGLDRKQDHQSLLTALHGLRGVEDDEVIKFQVNYVRQTLLYLPDDETSWQAFLRHAESVTVGVPAIAGVFKLDPMNALAAVEYIQHVAGNAVDAMEFNADGTRALQATAIRAAQAGERVYWSNKKEAWFLTLQTAHAFVREGRLVDFNKLVCNTGCRFDFNFQLGVCQILEEISADQLWDDSSRKRAIDFLGEIYKVEVGRKKDGKIQKLVVSILRRITRTSWPIVSTHATALLTNLKEDQAANTEDHHPWHFSLPLPTSSPLLSRVHNKPDIEHDVARIKSRSLEEPCFPFSIPPRAKATLLDSDKDSFPLMERVREFLKSDRQVFLLLGDSGSGKSTFCRMLERELWDNYKVGGRIPLYIDLPTIKKPCSDLIQKFLRDHHGIEDHKIQKIKRRRQLLLICDGYDELQLTANIYTTNRLSQLGDVKMVVSCRNTFLSRKYEDRFRPSPSNKYHAMSSSLFEEATITPFTEDNIQDFITRYVTDRTAAEFLGCVSVSSQDEYMRWLRAIPSVMKLAENPFLLTLALKALPSLPADALGNINLEATRLDLYDYFAKEWFQVSERRIARARLSQEACRVFYQLRDMDFGECAKAYCIRLATAIYLKNGGCPFVEYKHLSRTDNPSWKGKFFGPDPEPTLLREASPLSRVGTQHRFIHKSLLDYFASVEISDFYVSDDSDSGGLGDVCHGGGSALSSGRSNSTGGSGNSSSGNSGSTGVNHNWATGNGGMSDRTCDSGEGICCSKGDGDDPQRPQKCKDDTCLKRKSRSDKIPSTSSKLLTRLNLFKTPAVLQFLEERARSDLCFKKHMLMIIEQSKSSTTPDLAGANAITILFKSGESFHDVNLDSVQVPFDYTLEESSESSMSVTPWTGIELVDVLLASEAEELFYSQATQSTQIPLSPCSELLPPTSTPPAYDNTTGTRRMLDLLGGSWDFSNYRDVVTMALSQLAISSFSLFATSSSTVSQISNYPPDDDLLMLDDHSQVSNDLPDDDLLMSDDLQPSILAITCPSRQAPPNICPASPNICLAPPNICLAPPNIYNIIYPGDDGTRDADMCSPKM